MRVVKSPSEIALMKTSCAIGAESMKRTIKRSAEFSYESQFLACIEYESKIQGANFLAYPPVVAAGNNANTIHYIAATDVVNDTDLLLIDAGCEYHGYASDITRTWPVGGRYSDAQQAIYEIVLDTQRKIIDSIVPGTTTVDGLYGKMQAFLGRNLQEIGLIDKNVEYLSAKTHEFCPHHVSHYLGMDVHDCGKVSKKTPLVPGMIITVEPGCYIPSNRITIPVQYRGIGCRIEDDILITNDGVEILSRHCPTDIDEIQNLLNEK